MAFYFWIAVFLYVIEKNVGVAPEFPNARSSLPHVSLNEAIIGGKLTTDFMLNCPEKCRCNIQAYKTIVDCSKNQLKNIPPKVYALTSELHLSQNQLIDISYNISLSKLEVLNVSDNDIIQIDTDWISTLHSLHYLDLSKNNLQSKALQNLFSNLSLRHLNLSNNKLDEISDMTFYALDSLKELDLSNNNIQKIDYNSFQTLRSLEMLDLSLNRLTDLKHEWFKNLKSLKTLIVKKNRLQLLSNVVFWPLNNLKFLDLSENSIFSIGLLSFKGLLNLETLNISHNDIIHMQEGIFRPLEHAKVIDLSGNPFQTTDRIFNYAASLETLHLKFLNNFKTLTPFSLQGLTHLHVLDLSGSQSLSDINRYAFMATKNLKTLDISDSNLTNLKNGVFKVLPNIETIKLKGNPWKCDCYLYWILLWLSENYNTHLLSPSETFCHSPPLIEGNVLLDALDHNMVCTNASIHHYTRKAQFRVGSTALLQCQAGGSPFPILTWVTPQKLTFHWLGTQNSSEVSENVTLLPLTHPRIHTSNNKVPEDNEKERFFLMNNGNLLIRNIERGDGGFYLCIASNPLSNQSIAIRLTLDYGYLVHIKIVSVLVGMATSFGFLLLTLLSVLIKMILKRCGVKCPCRSGKSSPKTQQIRKILESMEHYKKQQLDRLRDNYNFQVQRIKDNCMQQMERLRESYSSQAERLRDIRDYGTLQIDRIRENYYSQVQRVRDYSTCQIERLRENYLFQRNRIRKFSTNHMYKIRENYKLQQQHLNKILENLNLESCRNVCQRTDSIVFEPDIITLENVFVPKICLQSFSKDNCDSVDTSSQISAYFTPDEAGSEISGHESDDQDCVENTRIMMDILNSEFNKCVEIKESSKNPPQNSQNNSTTNMQPDVIVLGSKLVTLNANETIV